MGSSYVELNAPDVEGSLPGSFFLFNKNPRFWSTFVIRLMAGLQIYGGPGSLSHDFRIWPITFQGSGPSGPILFSCEKSHIYKKYS